MHLTVTYAGWRANAPCARKLQSRGTARFRKLRTDVAKKSGVECRSLWRYKSLRVSLFCADPVRLRDLMSYFSTRAAASVSC